MSYDEGASATRGGDAAKAVLIARHGREDFTIATQEDMLRRCRNILDVLTMAVGALGSISLLVGGVGIVTIMTIAVAERTSEIGLLLALGARRARSCALFLGEAVVLAALGGAARSGARHRAGAADPRRACRRCRCHTPLVLRRAGRVLAVALIGLSPACCRRGARRCSIRWRRCGRSSAISKKSTGCAIHRW